MLNIIKSYLSLEMSAKDFRNEILNNDDLIAYIQTRLPATKKVNDTAWESCPLNVRAVVHDRFDLRRTLATGYYALTRVGRCSTAYNMIFNLFHEVLPDVEHSNYYDEIFDIGLDAIPEVFDSPDVGCVLFNIIISTEGMLKTKRKKAIREMITEAFHLKETTKKPSWIQGSEWPLGSSDKPMRFVGQNKKKGELVEYTFEDVDTLENRIIVQYY